MLAEPELWISLLTLTTLEIVLGIDNIIFIAILAGRLPPDQRERARRLGLMGAFVSRLGLLFAISWIVGLTEPLFEIYGRPFSGKSVILLLGGAFLVFKATKEIHHKLEAADEETPAGGSRAATFSGVIVQAMILDLVFSIDSVITAVGMTPYVSVMIAANVVALIFMLVVGKGIAAFIERHPSVKVLALAFLMMIGIVLIAESLGTHVGKGYIYGAMAFSVFVEMINIRTTRKTRAVALNQVPHVADLPPAAPPPAA